MSTEQRRIFAFSGILKPQPSGPPPDALVNFAIGLAATSRPVRRLCYIPTAVGDRQDAIDHCAARFADRDDIEFSVLRLFTQPSVPDVRAHLLSQDVILVEGGSVVNLIAVWRAHGLPQVLRECWAAGTVLTGASAGSLCWHVGGPTDSYRDSLDPFTGGLTFLPHSNGVHDDLDDQPRRAAFRELIANGELPAGYATEDGVGLLYAGTTLLEAVTILPGRHAWHVTPDGNGGYVEQAIVPRLITTTTTGQGLAPTRQTRARFRSHSRTRRQRSAREASTAHSHTAPARWEHHGDRLLGQVTTIVARHSRFN